MPPKRKKTVAGLKSEPTAAAKESSDSDETCPLATLLSNIQLLSCNKTRCTELMQAFSNNKCGVLEKKSLTDEHTDCYWILLATHMIQRMVQHLEKQPCQQVAVVLSALCHALARALYADKSNLERSAHNVARTALGRAIISVTIGSVVALKHLGGSISSPIIRRAMWSAVISLDMVVNHASIKITASGDGWNHALFWLLEDASHLDMQHEQELVAVCESASRALRLSKEEKACIACLREKDAPTVASPAAAGKRRRHKDEPQSILSTQFQSVIDMDIVIDGRVSIRRWASMTFVWFCQGQEEILKICNSILSVPEYWTSVLDCPAVIGPRAPPEPTIKTRSPRKKIPGETTMSPPVHIPGNVATSALVARLLNVAAESGSSCGARAPTGGMDTYAALVLGLTSGKGRSRSAAESLPSWTRADSRNLASVVIYKLVKAHDSCLRTNCTSLHGETLGWVLVNDESEGLAAAVPNTVSRPLVARFYPSVHRTLNSVITMAASIPAFSMCDSTKRLGAIAAAFVLATGTYGEERIVDAKLYGFAIGQLSSSLAAIVGQDEQAGGATPMDLEEQGSQEERHARFVEERGLDQPVPVPSLSPPAPEKAARKKKNTKKSESTQEASACTFGGIFPVEGVNEPQKLSDEDFVSLLIRGIVSRSDDLPAAATFSELIEIVRCCYNPQEPQLEDIVAETTEAKTSKRSGKKRATSSKASHGKKKQQKLASGQSAAAGGAAKTNDKAPRSMWSSRARLATDTLNVLRILIQQMPASTSDNLASRELRNYLRESLTTDHVCSVVDLSRMITDALMESHLASKLEKKASGGSVSSAFFSKQSGDYRHFEILLWTAHINLCQTIGRGEPSYDPRRKVSRPILGDAERRLAVFRAVAEASTRTTPTTDDMSSTPDRWPLCLPEAQHALVVSNLISEPIPNEADSSPERFIADLFMSSIADALRDPSMLTHSEWYKSSAKVYEDEAVVARDDFPLALKDARILLLAVSRLSKKQQLEFLNKFVGSVSSALEILRCSESFSALIRDDADVSGFLARVVTVCSTLVTIVRVGPQLREVFALQIGPTLHNIPNFAPREEMTSKSRQKDGDWYRCETSFVGLFSDWESPSIPDVTGPLQVNAFADETVSNLRNLLESAIRLGFLSAKSDRGHLLFASWNASGSSASWDSNPLTISPSEISTVSDESSTRLLLDIRDDICLLNREMHAADASFPQSILTRLSQQRNGGRRTSVSLKGRLETMMSKAERLIDSIVNLSDTEELPSASFALLEALSVYVAFIMSAHTRTIDHFLSIRCSTTRGRPGDDGALSDEDSTGSGAEMKEDRRMSALMELSDACVTFGAAPTHPDWLDVSCYLQDGITAVDATGMAHRAVTCLQRLCSTAQKAHVSAMFQSLSSWVGDDPNGKIQAALALRLSRVQPVEADDTLRLIDDDAQNTGEAWTDAIASLCGVDKRVVQLFSEEYICWTNTSHANKAFGPHSAQRIFGRLREQNASIEEWEPSLAELRACGEWELLISESLLGSCMNVDFGIVNECLPSESSAEPGWKRAFVIARHWARVQEACVSHLMPATALLRFGMSGALGRKRHPLANHDLSAESGGLHFHDSLPSSETHSQDGPVNDSIMRTLATLARMAASSQRVEQVKRPCAAVASNLMIDSKFFSELEAMEVLSFTFVNMFQIRDRLAKRDGPSDTNASSVSYLSERLIGCVKKSGALSESNEEASPRLTRLLCFLGGDFRLSFDTIAKNNLDYTAIVSSSTWQNGSDAQLDCWDLQQIQDRAITEMIGMVFWDESGVTALTWSCVSYILANLLELEHEYAPNPDKRKESTSLLPRMIKTLNGESDSHRRALVKWVICHPPVDPRPDAKVLEKISASLCTFLSYVIGAAGCDFQGGRVVLDSLLESMDQWSCENSRIGDHIMALLCLLGVRYNALYSIGSRLMAKMNSTESDENECMGLVKRFFGFVQDLKMLLSGSRDMGTSGVSLCNSNTGSEIMTAREFMSDEEPATDRTDSPKQGLSQEVATTSDSAPRACSFVLKSGFHAQHWYNCYTCGLVCDKGCCSLCALMCHQGHDVAYSRHSSFFCDCGGEAPTDEENRVHCKCLSPIEPRDAENIFEGEEWALLNRPSDESDCVSSDSEVTRTQSDCSELYMSAAHVASSRLQRFARSSLDKLRTEALRGTWTSSLFELLRSRCQLWSPKDRQPSHTDVATAIEEPRTLLSVVEPGSNGSLVPSLHGRTGKASNLELLRRQALVPIRSFRASSFQLGLSNDSTTDRMKRAMLSKNGIVRRALVADCRGRLIVAEPSSLLFCAILPSVNVRYEEKSSEVPSGRGQMSILGSSSVKFTIVGMELCRENERRLVVWGTSQASVMILSKGCDKVERAVELIFDLEPEHCEVDYLVKCAWIPGSQTILLVACGAFVKLFDLRLADDDKANSLASYSLAYEAVLRDVALVPSPSAESHFSTTSLATPSAGKVKLFVLLDIGHLLAIDLNFDESGQLKEQGDMYIESGEGISFPIGGVCMNHSTQIISGETRTRTLGEGSSLVFLSKSGVLLYSCVSSSVVALLLDATGNITGNFELLPNVIKGEVLGTTCDVKAPFTHWTELGVIDVDGAKFFRAVCVGKSSRTSQPKILCLDYNEDAVRVKEVAWSVEGTIGLGPSLSLTSSFDGIAAFSAPTIANDVDAIGRVMRSDFVERAFFCTVASNGSMLIFGEEVIATRLSGSTHGFLSTSSVPGRPSGRSGPSFPLTVFEQLVNVSDLDELTFDGDRIGGEPTAVKAKLSSKNSTYFMCPSRDGCTITLKLQRAYDHLGTTSSSLDKNEESALHDIWGKEEAFPALCDLMQNELVIVALRLLVGSTTTEFIPKYVSVEGRRVWLRPDVKKWYDLPLTADEISLGLRNGFVSIGIGPSFDSGNNPLVDAIEVYAARRGQISHWLPLTSLTSQNLRQSDKAMSIGTAQTETPSRENKLASLVLTLTHLLNVLGTDSQVTPKANRIIRDLIEATALDDDGETRQSLTSLLSCIELDPEERQKILDGGTLIGVSRALNWAKDTLQELISPDEGEGSRNTRGHHQTFLRDRWIRVRRTTKECLKASVAITRKRPGNYKEAIQHITTRENAARSIAAVACDIFAKGLSDEFECRELVPDLIELLLTESMLFVTETGKASSSFAAFDTLARLLKSSNEDIVTTCCESILSYWTEHLSKKSEPILYQCDSCNLFPIQGKRYTLLEGGSSSGRDSDIDLCSDCYQIGKGFAASNRGYTKVRINGRTVGKNAKLSCARFVQMKPVAILTTLAEGSNITEIATPASVSQTMSTAATAPPGAGGVLEKSSSVLFNYLLQLLADNLKDIKLNFSPSAVRSLADLVLNITKMSGDEDVEMDRAKQYAEALSEHIPHLIDIIVRHDTLEAAARPLLTTCIRGLSSLVMRRADTSGKSSLSNMDDCSVEDALPAKSKKTDPRFVCEVHGVAAVRRRCSHGGNKNRRFYVCGMARNSRCKYFKWADSDDGKLPATSVDKKSKWTTEIERFTWELFKEPRSADSRPLHVQLCMLLEVDAHDQDTGALSLPVEATGSMGRATRASETEKASSLLSSRYDAHAAVSDYVDGVFCSQEKLRAFTGQWLLEDYSSAVEDSIANQGEITIIKATLDLLSNIAGVAMIEGNNQHDDDEGPQWFSLLCEIISSIQSSHYRALAKRVLKRLCGGNRATYHSVRDHNVFRLHFQKLLLEAHSPLQAALNIKEQARQCGSHWRTGGKVDFDSLPAGGLIGTNDLVSEDCVTVARRKEIGAALDELVSVAKNRCANWRNFCSLTTLPQSRRSRRAAEQGNVGVDHGLAAFVEDPHLLTAPPIISLIWIACTLCGENQVKVLELIDIAMSTLGGTGTTPSLLPPVGRDTVSFNRESVDPQNSDGGTDVDAEDSGTFVPGSHISGILPSTVLLKGEKALLLDEVHAFVVHFVLGGESVGLRKVGGEVVFKICQNLQVEELEQLFVKLTERALDEVAELGSTCYELFQLLRSLASSKVRASSPQLIDVSRHVLDAFTTQMRQLRHAKSGLGEVSSAHKDVDTEKLSMERFDFTACVNCHREQASSSKGKAAASSRQSEPDSRGSTRTRAMPGASSSINADTATWLPEQVRPFARDSLEALTKASLSSEFSTYIQLKSRLAVSDIHLTIGDPRGRYVKTIAVYFSPRPVSDVIHLKSEECSDIWQRCATLSLSRGATRASCSLAEPVIAANLRVEYVGFYERQGGSRAADGSLLLHCPRCTRVVNNAHGVCGHCGEVAFQCRKCRHINYDRLDAFLCVECGYCSVGTFTYELTSGAASNAVAIVDDESYERTIKLLRVATKLHGEVRDALKERVRPVIGKRSLSVQKYGPALKRTFLGELPKINRAQTESGEGITSRMFRSSTAGSSVSRGRNDSNPLAAANRARSLLHLARQLRNDSSSERSRDGDFLIRQALLSAAGRGLSLEEIDDVGGDMVGFFSTSDLGDPDPLSRLVASIQGRVRMSAGRDSGSDRPARPSENNNAEGGTGDTSTKASSEECDRLYQLMRESERECFELRRRIKAWKRLENDALADLGIESAYASFSPSQCSSCSGPVALQLLILFVELFDSDPAKVQSIITEKSVLALFDEMPDMEKDLFDAKRMAIVTLGTNSEQASKLILEVLRTRLKASRDAASAEILGKIIAIDSTISEDFVKLAAEIMGSGY